MELIKSEIADVKDLLKKYKDKNVDKSFVINILSMLSDGLDENLQLALDKENAYPFVDMDTGIMFINIDKLNLYSYKTSESGFHDYKGNKQELYNYYSLITLLHEFAHMEQYYMMKNQEIPEIAKIYHDIMCGNIYGQLMYKLRASEFCHERNANLNAFRETLNIVEDKDIYDYFKSVFLYILSEYYDNYGLTPVKHTYKMLLKKYNENIDNISLADKIMHGLYLTHEEYDDLFLDFDGIKSYEEIDEKRIIKLTRK